MAVFGDYARYYDALYQEKDYQAECDFLEQIFKLVALQPIHSVLDLGCGTGGHALLLARRGYIVTGVDCSEQMLKVAQAKAVEASLPLDFHEGDIRNLDLGQTFDAVIAMFAVISYQTTNDDVTAAFRTARRHLEPGGLFIFDVWFGPAVLTQRPTDRFKEVQQGETRILRYARPHLDTLSQTVRVDYSLLHVDGRQVLDEVKESHVMRFFFPQELSLLLETRGFRMVHLCPFPQLQREASPGDWNVGVVAQAS